MKQVYHVALPLELWEEVFLWLPPGETLSMRLLNHELRELVDNSPAIKYHLDLFSAGLEETAAGDLLTLQDRRQKLEAYCSRWENFDRAQCTLLDPSPFPNGQMAHVDRGFLVYDETTDDGKENIHFVRLPSPTMEIPREEWTIRGLPASGIGRAIYPPSNLLAIPVLSGSKSSFKIKMFRMSDGEPWLNSVHSSAMGKNYGPETQISEVYLQLTGYRLAARVLTTQMDFPADLFVWDWRTGKMHLEHIQSCRNTTYFIDEFRLIGTVRRDHKTMLMLWDSSTDYDLHDSPGLMFGAKPNYRIDVICRNHRNYGTSHGLPFRGSPPLGITAFTTYGPTATAPRVLIIPVRALVSFAHLIGKVEYVTWQDWYQFTVPIGHFPGLVRRILHSQVLSVHRRSSVPVSTSVLRVFDFSLRSRRRKVKDDPSAPLPPYTVQEISFDTAYYGSAFGFTEGGVFVGFAGNQRFWAV